MTQKGNIIKRAGCITVLLLLIQISAYTQDSFKGMWYQLGADSYLKLRFEEAINYYTQSIAAKYKEARSYAFRASAEMLSGKMEDAENDLHMSFQLDSTDGYMADFKSRLYLEKGFYDTSLYWALKAIRADAAIAEFYDDAAMAYMQLKQFDMAIKYEKNAMKIDPANIVFMGNMGFIKQHMEKYEEAIADYNKVLKIAPDDITNLTNVAFCRYKLKQYQGALEICTKVLQKSPEFGYPMVIRGLIYAEMGHKKESCAEWKRAAATNGYHKMSTDYMAQYACPVEQQ